MAMVSPYITTEVFEIDEFPEVGDKYKVTGVPKTVINDRLEFVGAAPESYLVEKVLSLNHRDDGGVE
jgi:hypothetical protein